MKASELSVGDIGKTFMSPMYRDNNKTSLPIGQGRRRGIGVVGEARKLRWTLSTLYAHENGNIKINNGYHLRADTELEEVPYGKDTY